MVITFNRILIYLLCALLVLPAHANLNDVEMEELYHEIDRILPSESVLSKLTFDERLTEFIRVYNESPLLRRRPSADEIQLLAGQDTGLQQAISQIYEKLNADPLVDMNGAERLDFYRNVKGPLADAARILARQMLREDAATPLAREFWEFSSIEQYNLHLISIWSRWTREPESREALTFLATELGNYKFNQGYFDQLKLSNKASYQASRGFYLSTVAAALYMTFRHGPATAAKYWKAAKGFFGKSRHESVEGSVPAGRVDAGVGRRIGRDVDRRAGRGVDRRAGGSGSVNGNGDEVDPRLLQLQREIHALEASFGKPVQHASAEVLSKTAVRNKSQRLLSARWFKKKAGTSAKDLGLLLGIGSVGAGAGAFYTFAKNLDQNLDLNDKYIIPLNETHIENTEPILEQYYLPIAVVELQCRALDLRARMNKSETILPEHYDDFLELVTDHRMLLQNDPTLVEINEVMSNLGITLNRESHSLIASFTILGATVREPIVCPELNSSENLGLDPVRDILMDSVTE